MEAGHPWASISQREWSVFKLLSLAGLGIIRLKGNQLVLLVCRFVTFLKCTTNV